MLPVHDRCELSWSDQHFEGNALCIPGEARVKHEISASLTEPSLTNVLRLKVNYER